MFTNEVLKSEWYKTRKQETESGESIREEEEESVLMPGEVSAPGDYHISLIATVKRHSSWRTARLVWLANEFTPRIKYSASCWHHHLSVRIQLYQPAAMWMSLIRQLLLCCVCVFTGMSLPQSTVKLRMCRVKSGYFNINVNGFDEPNTALDGWPCQVGLV